MSQSLTGRNLLILLVAGLGCLTLIGCIAMLTGHNGTLLTGIVGGIAAIMGIGTGRLTLGK